MADWKEMYLVSARATEQAIRILIQAQQTCEGLYLNEGNREAGAGGINERKSCNFPKITFDKRR